MAKKWMGSTPKCDFCKMDMPNLFVDGKTIHGPWAMMCLSCFDHHGVGLGLGKGQQYIRQEDGSYKKVAG